MNTIDIQTTNLLIVYSLLAVPFLIFAVLRIPLMKKLAVAVLRMTLQLALAGLYLKYIFQFNHPALNIGWMTVMILVANASLHSHAGLRNARIFFLTLAGIAVSTVFTACFFILLSIRPQPFYDAQYFIPITGMILGNCMRGNILSLERFFSSIRENEKEYQTRVFMGATLFEACLPYLRAAARAAVTPTVSTIATIGLVSLPGMMTGQILGGSVPTVAIKYQIAIMICILVAASLGIFINLMLCIRAAFNPYGMLEMGIFKK